MFRKMKDGGVFVFRNPDTMGFQSSVSQTAISQTYFVSVPRLISKSSFSLDIYQSSASHQLAFLSMSCSVSTFRTSSSLATDTELKSSRIKNLVSLHLGYERTGKPKKHLFSPYHV